MRPLRVPARLLLLTAALTSLAALVACDKVQENVVLSPKAHAVEFAMDTPSENVYILVGSVTGEAAGTTIEEAESSARNDLRNKAAAIGASLVVIDEDDGAMLLYQDKSKITIKGRAFKSIE